MRLTTFLVLVTMVPLATASAVDVHIGTDEQTGSCSGSDYTDDGWYYTGANSTYSYHYATRDDQCDTHDDVADGSVSYNGTTLASAGYGDSFQGHDTSTESAWNQTTPDGSTNGSWGYEYQEGNYSKGAHGEAAGHTFVADRSRCEGTRGSSSSWFRNSTEEYGYSGNGHDETCKNGAFLSLDGANVEDAQVGSCDGWGYDGRSQNSPESFSNQTYDWRYCHASQTVGTNDTSVTVTYAEGHLKDCYGGGNRTSYSVYCADYGGAGSVIQVSSTAPIPYYVPTSVYVPMELGLLS